jgi:hypothetical protein
MRKFFAMEERGELPGGTAKRWADHTPNIGRLPERLSKPKRRRRANMQHVRKSMRRGRRLRRRR